MNLIFRYGDSNTLFYHIFLVTYYPILLLEKEKEKKKGERKLAVGTLQLRNKIMLEYLNQTIFS
jgi:hypothetical protein